MQLFLKGVTTGGHYCLLGHQSAHNYNCFDRGKDILCLIAFEEIKTGPAHVLITDGVITHKGCLFHLLMVCV